MKKINTVLGEIDESQLGDTLIHEHVICVSTIMRNAFGEKWVPTKKVADRAVAMLRQCRDCGVRTVVDGTPIELGRDVRLMRDVSARSEVHIIASSGLYYGVDPTFGGKAPEIVAAPLIEECKEEIGDTGIKPGILKCATGYDGVTEINRMQLTAMAMVQHETGLPLFAHNEHARKTAYFQLDTLMMGGANPEQIIVGHCSDSRDIAYLEDLLRRGCYLGFDRIYPSCYEQQAQVMAELIRRGWEEKLLVSHDYFACNDFGMSLPMADVQETPPVRNFSTVHQQLFPALLKLGATEKQIAKIAAENPRRILCAR